MVRPNKNIAKKIKVLPRIANPGILASTINAPMTPPDRNGKSSDISKWIADKPHAENINNENPKS